MMIFRKLLHCFGFILAVILDNNWQFQVFCDDNISTTIGKHDGTTTTTTASSIPETSTTGTTQGETNTTASNSTEQKWHYLYEHINRTTLEETCEEAKKCPSSELYWLVCGSDDANYLNLGLLACAQRCKKELKLKGFGPCENSKPLPKPTLPTISTTTTSEPKARELSELVSEASEEEKVLQYLKSRIARRHNRRGKPLELEEWCRDNPDRCPYGYDPAINRGVYLIPAVPYEESDA